MWLPKWSKIANCGEVRDIGHIHVRSHDEPGHQVDCEYCGFFRLPVNCQQGVYFFIMVLCATEGQREDIYARENSDVMGNLAQTNFSVEFDDEEVVVFSCRVTSERKVHTVIRSKGKNSIEQFISLIIHEVNQLARVVVVVIPVKT